MTKKKEPSIVFVLHPNGERDTLEVKELKLEHAQELVGGWVKPVPLFNKFEGEPCVVLCDEEGKLKQKPANTRATIEWKKCLPSGPMRDMLVGSVVVITGPARRSWG